MVAGSSQSYKTTVSGVDSGRSSAAAALADQGTCEPKAVLKLRFCDVTVSTNIQRDLEV